MPGHVWHWSYRVDIVIALWTGTRGWHTIKKKLQALVKKQGSWHNTGKPESSGRQSLCIVKQRFQYRTILKEKNANMINNIKVQIC